MVTTPLTAQTRGMHLQCHQRPDKMNACLSLCRQDQQIIFSAEEETLTRRRVRLRSFFQGVVMALQKPPAHTDANRKLVI